MQEKHPVREVITWNGAPSVTRMNDALRRGRAVELELSTELHDAALSRLVSDEDRDAEPVLEIRGGHELITKLAGVDALAPMTNLAEPVREKNYRLAVTSTVPVIFIEPSSGADTTRTRPAVTVPFRTPGTV